MLSRYMPNMRTHTQNATNHNCSQRMGRPAHRNNKHRTTHPHDCPKSVDSAGTRRLKAGRPAGGTCTHLVGGDDGLSRNCTGGKWCSTGTPPQSYLRTHTSSPNAPGSECCSLRQASPSHTAPNMRNTRGQLQRKGAHSSQEVLESLSPPPNQVPQWSVTRLDPRSSRSRGRVYVLSWAGNVVAEARAKRLPARRVTPVLNDDDVDRVVSQRNI